MVQRCFRRNAPTSTEVGPSDEVRAALNHGEMVRARTFARAIAPVSISALVVQFAIGRADLFTRTVTGVSLGLLAATACYVAWRARDPDVYAPNAIRLFGAVALMVSFVLIVRLGVLSPAGAAIVLGISFFGMGERALSIGVHVTAAIVAYVVFGMLVSFGVIPDRGLLPITGLSVPCRIVMVALTGWAFVIAAFQARRSRRATALALAEVERVTLRVRLRESQLAETRHHLEVAFQAYRDRGRYEGALAGPYLLADIVGRGAMGEVYAAEDPASGEKVAVKLLRADAAQHPSTVRRFLREAAIARNLRSPYLVEVRAAGQMEDGAPYIAMELLRGSDLGALLRRDYRMSVGEILELAHDVGHALDVAHRAGVVHRDLKPQNVYRIHKGSLDDPGWKVLDFGVCSLLGSTGTLTDKGLVGTPHYMSPEQARGTRSDHRGDVFAMGVLLYRVLTGQLPFAGDGHRVLYAIIHETPLRPRELAPWIPPDVERVLAIALAKSPLQRFDSAVELSEALRAAVNEELPDETRVRADEILRASPWRREAVTTVVAGRRCLNLDADQNDARPLVKTG